MQDRLAETSRIRSALVLIPGMVNYFYNLNGRRIAEALRELHFKVDIGQLATCPEREYDWCILVNITEVLAGFGDQAAGLEKIRALRKRCRAMASCSLDCVATPWYHRLQEYCTQAGVEAILDLGLYDQRAYLPEASRAMYHFIPSGLTSSEVRELEAATGTDSERNIPWAFIGHLTPERAAIVDFLIQAVDPRGFVYLPGLAPYTEKGSPHLNQQQFERVLRHTRYQVWCSHHSHFYMEPERFRTSLLTGGVPVKVVESRGKLPKSVPFSYLLVEESQLHERLQERVFRQVRRRFQQDFLRLPRLHGSLADFLVGTQVLRPDEVRTVRGTPWLATLHQVAA
jgi:hypothetical protein